MSDACDRCQGVGETEWATVRDTCTQCGGTGKSRRLSKLAYENGYVVDADYSAVAVVFPSDQCQTVGRLFAANARLIAAAPDLLAACRAMLERPGWRSYQAARAAVAKAEGRE